MYSRKIRLCFLRVIMSAVYQTAKVKQSIFDLVKYIYLNFFFLLENLKSLEAELKNFKQ
jgi:hypothetical protein